MKINVLHMVDGAKAATGTAVIIDVFRAFSVEAYIMARGAEKLMPVGDMQFAYDYKKEHPDCVLIGERKGTILPGFDYGNSPFQIGDADFSGKTVIHTTSAGTQGIANAEKATEVITASLVNAAAVARYLQKTGVQEVSLVCMGLMAQRQTDEDNLCAAYIKSILEGHPIELTEAIENLKKTSGAKFFDSVRPEDYPREDFYMCTDVDKFDFVLRAEWDENGNRYIRRIDV